jgi:hypothetical protein
LRIFFSSENFQGFFPANKFRFFRLNLEHANQGDQIGRIFAHLGDFLSGQVFLMEEVAQIVGPLLPAVLDIVLILTKNGFG